MIAEFDAELTRLQTREGMKLAKGKSRLRGKAPEPKMKREAHLVTLRTVGEHTGAEPVGAQAHRQAS